MNRKNPLSVNTQIATIAECIKDLTDIVPELKAPCHSAQEVICPLSKTPCTQKSPLMQDLNRQEIVKSIIYCLRDIQYELLHKPIAKRKYASNTEKLTLDQVLPLLNVYEQDKLEEPLLKKTDSNEIKLVFERCHIRLSDVKNYMGFKTKLHTALQPISQHSTPAPAPPPIYNIEDDELF